MIRLTQLKAWTNLEKHAQQQQQPFLSNDHTTAAHLRVSANTLSIDYSHQHVDEKALHLLIDLARSCNLEDKIHRLMTGEIVNIAEQRPALHTALRVLSREPLKVNDVDIISDIFNIRERMFSIAALIRAGEWLGFSGQPITDIVNIGIGGSHLGPQFCIDALTDIVAPHLRFHFISDIDPSAFNKVSRHLKPETTLFIAASKSFTTQETLYNVKKAFLWMGGQHIEQHFIAITAHIDNALSFGFKYILPIWDWVGGRYSLCSAINLITCIAIGSEQFMNFLEGANQMDEHFRHCDFATNIPVLMALLGIWNNNFLHIHHLLLLTYAQDLHQLIPFIQQLDMESNGKSIDNQGKKVNYATGPIVWGGLANQAQHSYYQLLYQGTHKITADLISIDSSKHEVLNQMCNAHKAVLTRCMSEDADPQGVITCNIPMNHIRLADCSPRSLGALVALYEHKIFVQAVIWNINPFDQPGVVSSKKMMDTLKLTDLII